MLLQKVLSMVLFFVTLPSSWMMAESFCTILFMLPSGWMALFKLPSISLELSWFETYIQESLGISLPSNSLKLGTGCWYQPLVCRFYQPAAWRHHGAPGFSRPPTRQTWGLSLHCLCASFSPRGHGSGSRQFHGRWVSRTMPTEWLGPGWRGGGRCGRPPLSRIGRGLGQRPPGSWGLCYIARTGKYNKDGFFWRCWWLLLPFLYVWMWWKWWWLGWRNF